ncbi:uroporphyrinogen III methyltransferase [Vibrio inusitatus NBRC 102082]|uniref:Uroporphyrinogen-III synthase n=1 Tax=Vibrio inusitatus NBRC 102082 TaxID=1219070 RepID=A0A4Y3HVS5_9VIBR|nr:uroporphyrinogen-III synthase [Vibrio inusitatus]GEA51206.1 uroporphyrinogen III methyltransferase [Vibrio inusitatus NBRC 102082]
MKVLIVRPQPSAKELYDALCNIGVVANYCPVISFQQSFPPINALNHLAHSEVVIAVSQPSVHYTNKILTKQSQNWPTSAQYFAVGSKTATYLHSTAHLTVSSPKSEDTEGLLELLGSHDLKGRKVSILRGESGREMLYESLQQTGADVVYVESYQRQWLSFDGECKVIQWQQDEVDTLIVTSFEQLKFFAQQIPTQSKNWLHSLQLMVPSERVAKLASHLGFTQIHNIKGASNKAIIDSIQANYIGK